jgi:hypothetical protein
LYGGILKAYPVYKELKHLPFDFRIPWKMTEGGPSFGGKKKEKNPQEGC